MGDQPLSNGACNRNATPASLLKQIGGKFKKLQKAGADPNNKGNSTDASEDSQSSLSSGTTSSVTSSGSETSEESTSNAEKYQKLTKKQRKRKIKDLCNNLDDRVKMELRSTDGKIDMFKWQGGEWKPMGFNKLWLRNMLNPKHWPKRYRIKYKRQYEKFCAQFEELRSKLEAPTERKCRLCHKMITVANNGMTKHKRSIQCTGSKAYRDHQDVMANRARKQERQRSRERSLERARKKKEKKTRGAKKRRSRSRSPRSY